ncbi:50S ribosomal protein L24 [Candidatus Peregrinibacteria bacterium]|nr:50S ribosomal protein L24 [Candidatus Peregrinibacteria bacterium]
MMKLHVSDKVLVISGKAKGKTGKIMKLSQKHDTVTVEKMNLRTKHIKKRPGNPGQRIRYEVPMHASNVMVVCPNCSKPTRIAITLLKTGRKQRICKKCGQSLDTAVERKSTKKK